MTRKDVIAQVLRTVYWLNRESEINSCASLLDKSWDRLASEDPAWSLGIEHEVMLFVWNYFPGGGTAKAIAPRIVSAVEAINDK